MNILAQYKKLPIPTKRLLSLGIVLALAVALPLFIWAVATQRFNIIPRAATGEPIPTPIVSPMPTAGGECGLCGGIAGISCQTGLMCQKSGTIYPDQSGMCVKPDGSSYCPRPTPSCMPRPACLDSTPRCLPPQPVGGWCPNPPPTKPTPSPIAECQPCILYGGISLSGCQSGMSCQGSPGSGGNGLCKKNDGTSNCPAAKYIHVLSPNGGETITKGTHYTIRWEASGLNSYLIYLADGQGHYSLIKGAQAPTTFYDWVADSPIPGTQFKIIIADGSTGGLSGTQDSSDGFFNLISQPPPTVRPFTIQFKFQGVNDDSASYFKLATDAAKVTVKFLSSSLGYSQGFETSPIMVDYTEKGVYSLHFGVVSTQLPAANDYAITLKGEKHVAIKFCQNSGQNAHCSGTGNISLPADPSSPIVLDFTGIPLPPGDLYPQDGAVTTLGANSDLARLLMLLAKNPSTLTKQDLLMGDLNYDGVINIKDLFLFRQTLQTRYDEY